MALGNSTSSGAMQQAACAKARKGGVNRGQRSHACNLLDA